MGFVTKGLLLYLLICTVSFFAGKGILRLLKIRLEARIALFFAPAVTLVFWVLLSALGICFQFTARQISALGWILTIGLIGFGVFQKESFFLKKDDWAFTGVVISLPPLLMSPYFGQGLAVYLGSTMPDGWSYIAFGQYLWENLRGAEGGLSPLHQYAAHLARGRFVASALLGFFSPLVGSPGDTQTASGFFLAWSLFTFSASCLFFAAVKKMGKMSTTIYLAFCGLSGWLLNLLWTNNYDNALAISFSPALAGIILLTDGKTWRWGILLGCFTAGVLYCYPEMALFILAGSGILFIWRLFSNHESLGDWKVVLIVTGALAGALIAPFGKDILWFVKMQSSAANLPLGARPGEGYFADLLDLSPNHLLPAFWGVGGDFLKNTWWKPTYFLMALKYLRRALSFAFTLLSILGILKLSREKEWGILGLWAFFLLGASIMLLQLAYPYGAYKFILLNWWAMALTLVWGIQLLANPFLAKRKEIKIFSLCLVLIFFSVTALRIYSFRLAYPKTILEFKELEKVKTLLGEVEPLMVAVDDDLANQWAVYYLRDLSIYLVQYRSYMAQPHVLPFMDRAKAVKIEKPRYVLSDSAGTFRLSPEKAVWVGGPYSLWKLPDAKWVLVTRIHNRNGLENWQGRQGFWMGQGVTELILLAGCEGRALLSADFLPGPSLPDKPDRQILISSDQGYRKTITIDREEKRMFTFPVKAGKNRIVFQPLDRPSLKVLPNGDNRPLLVGVHGLQVAWADEDLHEKKGIKVFESAIAE